MKEVQPEVEVGAVVQTQLCVTEVSNALTNVLAHGHSEAHDDQVDRVWERMK